MFNLLPENEKKKIKKEYLFRFFAIALSFFLATAVIASVFLLPSYVFSLVKEHSVTVKNDELRRSIATNDSEAMTRTVSDIRGKINMFKPTQSLYVYELIGQIISLRPQSVTLSSLDIVRNTDEFLISIRGNAGTRDDLLVFQNKLETNKNIRKVELPVSDLLREKNIDFSIKISAVL
jgi:hypothetical protein